MSKVKVEGVLIKEGLQAASGFSYSRAMLEEMVALLPGKPILCAREEGGGVVGWMSDDPADFEIAVGEDGRVVLIFKNALLDQGDALLKQVEQEVTCEIGIGATCVGRVRGDVVEEIVRVESVAMTMCCEDLPFSSGRVTGIKQGEV